MTSWVSWGSEGHQYLKFWIFYCCANPVLLISSFIRFLWFYWFDSWVRAAPSMLVMISFTFILFDCHIGRCTKDWAMILSFIFWKSCCVGMSTSSVFIILRAEECDWVRMSPNSTSQDLTNVNMVDDSRPIRLGFVAVTRI